MILTVFWVECQTRLLHKECSLFTDSNLKAPLPIEPGLELFFIPF